MPLAQPLAELRRELVEVDFEAPISAKVSTGKAAKHRKLSSC